MRWRKWIALLLTLMLTAGLLPAAMAAGSASPVCDHSWKVIHTTATCTEGGLTSYICTKCGAVKEERVGPLGHDMGPRQTDIAPTCTEPGREIRVCRRNKAHIWSYVVEPLGHDWGDWEVVTQPTTTSEGLERRVCKRDPSHVEEHIIPKLEEDEAPPLAEISLTGSIGRPYCMVGDGVWAHYVLTNVGDVPLTYVDCDGDAVGQPLPAVLAPAETFSWDTYHEITQQDFENGFYIDPDSGGETGKTYSDSTYAAFAAVEYVYDPGEGNLWDCYETAYPTTHLAGQAEGASLTLTVKQTSEVKTEYEPYDTLTFQSTLLNNGLDALDNCYTVFSDDKSSFTDASSMIYLAPGDITTNIGWSYTIKPEDAGTTFYLCWTGYGEEEGSSGTEGEIGDFDGIVMSNTVKIAVRAAETAPAEASLTLTNADGSGAGKVLGDWVTSTLTFTNTGETLLLIIDETINGPASMKYENIDYSSLKALIAMTCEYFATESDSYTMGFQILPDDVAAGAVIRTITLVAQRTDTHENVYSNPVTVNIPLDGGPVPGEKKAALSLAGVSDAPDPIYFDFDGNTVPVTYDLIVKNTGDVPVKLTAFQYESEGDPNTVDMSYNNYVLMPDDTFPISYAYTFHEFQVIDGDKLWISFDVIGESEYGEVESNPVKFIHTTGEIPPWEPETALEIHKMEAGSSYNLGGYVEGETVHYDVTITNNSDQVIESVTVHDDHDPEHDKIITNLQPYESKTVSFEYTIQPEDVEAGCVVNEASATWFGPVPGTISRVEDFCIVDVIETPDRESYGVYLEKSTIGTPPKGYYTTDDVITFYIYVENTSTQELYNVVVTDPMNDDVTYPVMAPNQTDDIVFTHTVTFPEALMGSLTNTATITGYDKDGNVYTWTDSVTVPTDVILERGDSLYLYKEEVSKPLDKDKGYKLDEKISYKITYANDGMMDLYNVIVYDLAPDGTHLLGVISHLVPGETGSFTFDWTVCASDFPGDWVYNTAMAYYDTDQIYNKTVFSNTVQSPIWCPDPPPETPEGRDEVCVTTLTAMGADSAWYDLDLCPEHAETAAKTAELLAEAYGSEATLEVWKLVGEMWLEETHEMYDILARMVDGEDRAAVYADRAALDHYVANMDARLNLMYPDDPVIVAKAKAEWLMRQCAELCYLSGKAPEDRPDSQVFGRLTPPPSLVFAGEEPDCLMEIIEDGTDKVQISERLCAAHAKDADAIATMLKNSRNRKQYADVFTRAQRLWRADLNQIASAAYNDAAEDARQAVITDSLAFSEWIAKRTELLNVFYPNKPEAVAEVICTLLREQVIILCKQD